MLNIILGKYKIFNNKLLLILVLRFILKYNFIKLIEYRLDIIRYFLIECI